MSYPGLSLWFSTDRMDVSLAKVGILVSILLLGLRVLAAQVFLLVIPLAAGIGSALYLTTRRKEDARGYTWGQRDAETAVPTLHPSVAGYLPAVVMLGLAGLVFTVHQLGARTDPVYLLTGVIGVAIFVQILFVDDEWISPGLVLFQILAAAVVIRLSALYVTPGFVGVDIWTHVTVFVEGIVTDGSLVPLVESKYLMAPFYHVIGAIGALVLGGAKNGVYLTLGLLIPLSALFVYSTATLLVPVRWALLATALFAFSDQFIRWGMHIIPTSLGLVFFLAAVYAITRIFARGVTRWAVWLLLASSLAIVFTHQVSTAIVLTMLGLATLVSLGGVLPSSGPSATGGFRRLLAIGGVFVVTLTTTFVSWSMTPFSGGGTFLWGELAVLQATVAEAGFLELVSMDEAAGEIIVLGGNAGTLLSQLIPYVELIGFALLLLAAVVGGLYLLRQDGAPGLRYTHVLTAIVLFVIVFGLSLFGIRALLPGRWLAFLYVSMTLLAAAGGYHLAGRGSRRVVVALFVLIALGYPTTMVVAEKATLDNPAFEGEHKRFAYSEAEIAGVETITALKPATGDRTLGTDHPYVSVFRRYGGYGYDASILEVGPEGPESTDMAVYRSHQSTDRVTLHRGETSPPAALSEDPKVFVCPPDWNKGYTNDEVDLCTPSSLSTEEGA